MKTPVVLDGRRVLNKSGLEGAGVEYFGVGYLIS